MSIHQEHFGRKFYQDKKTGYWISCDYSKERPRVRAHQWVWLNHFKIIPKGYHIHHRNEDKSDNRIENLEMIERARHLSHHMNCPLRKAKSKEMADKYRHLTKEWHASKEGHEWHKAHGVLGWINRKPIKMTCKVCQKEYETKVLHQDFCTNACKSQWRRNNKLDDIDKICPICKKGYRSSKYSRSKTCSKKCGGDLRRSL